MSVIVFSATHKASGKVFVGSCRVDLDFHWALLLAQAEEGVNGPLFELIREAGEDAFLVTEYAEADSARELPSLLREAQEELAAELIRSGSSPAAKPVRTTKVDEALLQEEESDDDLDGWLEDRRRQAQIAKPTVNAPVSPAPGPLRHTRSTEEAADMRALIASIEARRKSQRKSPPRPGATRSASSKSAPASGAAPARSTGAQVGKKAESAAARERRIKAALVEEKAAREASKQRQIAEEADEMARLMARLDARSKVTESIRRRR